MIRPTMARVKVAHLACCAALFALAGRCSAETYYLMSGDASGKSSFTWNGNGAGWKLSGSSSKKTFTSEDEFKAADFIIEGTFMRTGENVGDQEFKGHSLRIIGDGKSQNRGGIAIKNSSGKTITFPHLIFEDGVIMAAWAYTFTLAGDYTVQNGASAVFLGDSGDERGFIVTAVLHGDETTKIRAVDLRSSASEFRNLGDFFGVFESGGFNDSVGAANNLTISGPFSGRIGSLTDNTTLRANYDELPAGKGLRATCVSAAFKTKLVLYGATTDFQKDALPLLRFPAGTVVDPAEFSIGYSTVATGTPMAIPSLKTYEDQADSDYPVVLAVCATEPVTAKFLDDGSGAFSWHFYAFDGHEVTDSCGLTEPNDKITVHIGSVSQFNAIKTKSWTVMGYRLTAPFVADGDADFTSLASFAVEEGLVLDAQGHKITFPPSVFTAPTLSEITDTTGGGELWIDVPENTSATNATVSLTGKLKVVKAGAGTFSMNRKEQTYTGGTEILAGKLTVPAGNGKEGTWGGKAHLLGSQDSEIKVDAGATFDIAGNYDYNLYDVVMNGGTLRSGTASDSYIPIRQIEWGAMGWITLTADSTAYLRSDLLFSGVDDKPVDLGGYVFTVDAPINDKLVYWRKDVTNGTMRLKGVKCEKQYFQVLTRLGGGTQIEARTVDFIDEMGIDMQTEMNVRGYNPTRTWDNTNCTGTAALNVYGTFRPDSDYFYGCTMQDGSTIDLSGKTSAWSVTSQASQGRNTVDFAPGATVYVALDDSKVSAKQQIIVWDSGEKPDAKFRPLPGAGYSFVSKDDGLYVLKGQMVIIR